MDCAFRAEDYLVGVIIGTAGMFLPYVVPKQRHVAAQKESV
jgi:hypothetical protein